MAKVSFGEILKLTLVGLSVTLMGFLILEGLFGDEIMSLSEGIFVSNVDADRITFLFWITLSGFLFVFIIAAVITHLTSWSLDRPPDPDYIYYATIIALGFNLLLWTILDYSYTAMNAPPESVIGVSIVDWFLSWPRVITYGAKYMFGGMIPTFWMWAGITHVLLFSIFLWVLGARTRVRHTKRKEIRR